MNIFETNTTIEFGKIYDVIKNCSYMWNFFIGCKFTNGGVIKKIENELITISYGLFSLNNKSLHTQHLIISCELDYIINSEEIKEILTRQNKSENSIQITINRLKNEFNLKIHDHEKWQEIQQFKKNEKIRKNKEIEERIKQEELLRLKKIRLQNAWEKSINKILENNYLKHNYYFDKIFKNKIDIDYLNKKVFSFVKKWISNNLSLTNQPDDEQISAIAATNGHIQVVARAGSGKTTTLVNRTMFLLKHCRVMPDEIMILAFNRKAVSEIRKRLLILIDNNAKLMISNEINEIKQTGSKQRFNHKDIEQAVVEKVIARLNIILPHVMTFHALAYAIVHPEESLLYDGVEGESQGLSRTFQQVIDDHLREPEFREKIRVVMLAQFREDWDRIVEGRHDQSKEEFLRFRRSQPRECLGGEYVKSYGEKIIADFLFEHDIAYKYERNHWWSGVNYKPDFTIFVTPKSGLIIEYFGLEGDPDYDEMSEKKREYWKNKSDWTLIEFTPKDITSEGPTAFLEKLKTTLLDQDIQCTRLSEDEIWNRIRDRAIDRFTTASVGFVGRCRKLSLSPLELLKRIKSHSTLSSVEGMFLEIVHSLYNAYLNRLSSTGEEDFDGLMQRAAQAVENGSKNFQQKLREGNLALLRYVCIDEFQDFSELFYRLLVAIRKVTPQAELFCVGDDWQAINGFAGSDLKFFDQFEFYIGKSRRLYISTNYRSASSIITVGNTLMLGLGQPASASKTTAGKVIVSDLNKFEPSLIEKQRHPGDIITPAVLRITKNALDDGMDMVILCRRNGLPWFVNFQDQSGKNSRGLERYISLVRSYFPKNIREKISISTAHKYKGLEKKFVIVIDLVARSYPLIHPDWAFFRVLGDTTQKIIEEERRLLYVALTRAADTLVIFTEERSMSPFLEDLKKKMPLESVNWAEYPPVPGLTTRLVVKVGNQERRGGSPTFAIKDLLKASGYQWQSTGWPGWAKSIPSEEFKTDILKSEVWSEQADGIEVRIFDDTDALIANYLVDYGNWTCTVDDFFKINQN